MFSGVFLVYVLVFADYFVVKLCLWYPNKY